MGILTWLVYHGLYDSEWLNKNYSPASFFFGNSKEYSLTNQLSNYVDVLEWEIGRKNLVKQITWVLNP